jgi:hypothetical protein
MTNSLQHHMVIAAILKKEITMPYSEWRMGVFLPIIPFYDSLDGLISPRTKGLLTKANCYEWKPDDKKIRQCLTKQKWNFSHPRLPYRPDGLAAFVQLGDNETGEISTILWGVGWWGSKKNSLPIRDLFLKIKGDSELDERVTTIGATGTFLRIIIKKYTADHILSRANDIETEISNDITVIVKKMNDYVSK